MAEETEFRLDPYLKRVGFDGARSPLLPTLEGLHLAHLGHIPFENVDAFLGRSPGLDLETLQAKLVAGGRGGYCFEHNTLFAAALRALGFDVATLEARVRPPDATGPLPRTHMVLRVDVGGRTFLADVGFGGNGTLLPVPLDGAVSKQADADYRVEREEHGVHVLRRCVRGTWDDCYAFTLAPALSVDYLVANHYTSTHPQSPFVNTLTVQRAEPGLRRVLRGPTYTERRGDDETIREIGVDDLPELLGGTFGLKLAEEDMRRVVEKFRRAQPAPSDGP